MGAPRIFALVPSRFITPASGALNTTLGDEQFFERYIIGADPEIHIERIRAIEAMGATIVCLQNRSGADPIAAFETYRERVLPALRSAAGPGRV